MKFDKATVSQPSSLFKFLQERRKEKQFRQTVEVSVTLFFICFFLLLAIRPTVSTISTLIGDINTKKQMVKKSKDKINQIIQAQAVFSQIQADYHLIDNCLPSHYAFAYASTQIIGIGLQSGLDIQNINFSLSPDKGKQVENIPKFGYSLSTPIDFANITSLINDFSQNRRLFRLNSFSISPMSRENKADMSLDYQSTLPNPDQVNVTLDTDIFYLPKWAQKLLSPSTWWSFQSCHFWP